jgi:hypothetical protein
LKDKVQSISNSPQNSLKKISAKFVSLVDGVESTGIPQSTSAFDFNGVEAGEVSDEFDGFDFGGDATVE